MVEIGLIGYPLEHSFSALYFDKKFRKEGIEGHYGLYPLRNISEFPDFLERHPELAGFNVTIPYKEKIIPYLDSLDEDASRIGAVNTVKIVRDLANEGNVRLEGSNTDWIGFMKSAEPWLDGKTGKALILGTGGSSKAVAYALDKSGIEYLFVTHRKGKTGGNVVHYSDLDEKLIKDHFLIVNTTPLGMYPATDTYPDIPYRYMTKDHVCIDLVYNPEITRFMTLSKRYGATVKNGMEMLRNQAEESFKIWMSR